MERKESIEDIPMQGYENKMKFQKPKVLHYEPSKTCILILQLVNQQKTSQPSISWSYIISHLLILKSFLMNASCHGFSIIRINLALWSCLFQDRSSYLSSLLHDHHHLLISTTLNINSLQKLPAMARNPQ